MLSSGIFKLRPFPDGSAFGASTGATAAGGFSPVVAGAPSWNADAAWAKTPSAAATAMR